MGVTLYGIAPQKEEEAIKMLDNYKNLTEEEKQVLKSKILEEKEKEEITFSNNWWNWRPIVALINVFNISENIGIPDREINGLSFNDGIGISNPSHCLHLAKLFKGIVSFMKKTEVDTVHLVTDHWYYKGVTANGTIVENRVLDPETNAKLSEEFKDTEIRLGEIEFQGINYTTAHRTNIDNLENFISFLETCNGFIVY